MKGLIFDYGATIDSGGRHWSEVIWEGYCQVSLPVTKDHFREAYIYAERYVQFTPVIQPSYNFFELMQARIGIQIDYLIGQGLLNEDVLQAALKIFSEGEVPIVDNMHELAQHFVDIIAGYCYDYARRCTLDNIPLLEKLSDCYEIALVSNFYGNLASVIQDFGLSRCFRVVIDSAVVGVRKPDPAIFQLAIDRLNLDPKDITVIGDSYKKDIEPARELGCNAIWLRGSSWDNSDSAIDYEPTVTSLLQLFDMLQKNA